MEIDWTQQALVLTQGYPASGKTTWAKRMVMNHTKAHRVNRDEIRLELGFKYDARREGEVTEIQNNRIDGLLRLGFTVISDDTYLNPKHIENRREQAKLHKVAFHINDEFMQVSIEECIKRDTAREVSVGKDVIERLYFDFWRHRPKPPNTGPRTAILCDLDGTLALIPPGANPYSRDFTKDICNHAVAAAVIAQRVMGVALILLSGRDVSARAQTEEWLSMNSIPHDALLMRPLGDKRKDTIVKKEIYMDAIQSKWKVIYVLDDRPSVVRMWRAELGLTVFQIAPNWEF